MSNNYSQNNDNVDTENPDSVAGGKWLGSIGRLVLGVAVLAVGMGISIYWVTHRPTAQRRPPQPEATLVEVSNVSSQTEKVVVRAMGTVTPAKSIQLTSRVSGQIVEVSPQFVPGGHFKANDVVLRIEQKDYELAVEQRRSELVNAQHDLKLEMGQQSVAEREYELLARDVQEEDKELLLRRPQLEMAKAAVASAEASLEQAQLDLERTVIVSPFNSMVQSKNVDLGSQVNVNTVLAILVGMDEYWVEVSVPVDELRWINIPGYNSKNGSSARIYYESAWGPDTFREGTVQRLLTDLEPQGRMARLLVTVRDPHQLDIEARDRHPLILGSYVRLEIDGVEVPDIVKVSRSALREGNQVWVMNPQKKLEIRSISIAWGGNNHVYISDGLSDGELLITSDLGAPVQGMVLRTADASPTSTEPLHETIPPPQTEDQL